MLSCGALEAPPVKAPPPSPVLEATRPDDMESLVTCAVEKISKRILFDIDALIRTPLSSEPWKLCRVPADQIEPDDSDWNQIKSAPGIYIAGRSYDGMFYQVAVNRPYFPWLLLHRFKFQLELDPAKPVDVRVHGEWVATRNADARFLQDAVEAISSGRSPGLELCYRQIAPSRLQIPLEWAILSHDILESDRQVRARFTQCLVFLGLCLLNDYDNPSAVELLGKDQDELLQVFRKLRKDLSTSPPRNSVANFETKARSTNAQNCAEYHSISLLRCLLEFSGGREDFLQHKFDPSYTAIDNARLYGSLLDITGSNPFGNFDSQKMRKALLRSKVFTKDDISTLDVAQLSDRMMACLPIGFPNGYMDLPAVVLMRLGCGEVDMICVQIAHLCHEQPSLQRPENNILVLLIWSSIESMVNRVLVEWVTSDDGWSVYERILRDVQDSQTTAQLGLILAGLLGYQRLLPFTPNDTTRPIKGSYLADFDAIVNGDPLSNQRTVFERMAFSFLRVLDTFKDDHHNTRRLLVIVLDTNTPLLDSLDGISDQYWIRRMKDGLTHEDAFEMVGHHHLVEETVGLGMDEDWVILQSLKL